MRSANENKIFVMQTFLIYVHVFLYFFYYSIYSTAIKIIIITNTGYWHFLFKSSFAKKIFKDVSIRECIFYGRVDVMWNGNL